MSTFNVHIKTLMGPTHIIQVTPTDTVQDLKTIIQKFREAIHEMTFAIDIICGFPGETKLQFVQSLDLIKSIQPDIVNISRFTLRTNTLAEKLEDPIDTEEKKKVYNITQAVQDFISESKPVERLWKKGFNSSMI